MKIVKTSKQCTVKQCTVQNSPEVLCVNQRRNPSSSYQHMFLEDFCRWFSIDLAKSKDDRLFYDVLPEKSHLKKLLTSQNCDFLEYDMDKLLTHILRTLIFVGKAFVEVVFSYDEEDNISGISLVPFDPIFSIRGRNNTYFIALQHNWKPRFFKINKRDVVVFRLSDLGFRRYSLKRFYNKLPRFDILSAGDMSLSSQEIGFDFSVWNNRREYKLLKASKTIGWYGRSANNSHMGDAYLLYRAIQLKSVRRSFLDYFLNQINESISSICKKLGVEGTIIAKRVSYNYDDLLRRLHSGELNYSQLGDCVFGNKEI